MKFSQVAFIFSVLFALSYAEMDMAVAKSEDEVVQSNPMDQRQKRFFFDTIAKGAFDLVSKEMGKLCGSPGLSPVLQTACQCANSVVGIIPAGDEQMRSSRKRFVPDILGLVRAAVNFGCSDTFTNALTQLKDICICARQIFAK